VVLADNEYLVLQMMIEDGWRIPIDPTTDKMMKPRQVMTVPGGSETLVRLRRNGFIDYKNRITRAGNEAFWNIKRPNS
jgi:hypothetical protein